MLARFGLQAFGALQSQFVLVGAMILAYLLMMRRLWPRYAVVGVLATGALLAGLKGELQLAGIALGSGRAGVDGAALQRRRGRRTGAAAVRRDHGVAEPARRRRDPRRRLQMPISRIVTLTGVATLLLAPFGAFALNLSAITAAICMGREAHLDPARRYVPRRRGRDLLP